MKWRVPYIVAACMYKYNRAVKDNIVLGKKEYQATLRIEEDIVKAIRRPLFTGICPWTEKLSLAFPPDGPFWLTNGKISWTIMLKN